MKLYTFEAAPNPRRVNLFLQYKGVELETETVDIGKGEQFQESFKIINPDCTVPVLVLDDGTKLSDCIAICLYLESLYPHSPLFGNDALTQAQVIGWCHRIFIGGLVSVAEILRNQGEFFQNRALPGTIDLEQLPELVDRGKIRLAGYFNSLEQHLSGQNYIVGSSMSMADIDALVVADFAGWVKETIPGHCGNVQDWYQRVKEELGDA